MATYAEFLKSSGASDEDIKLLDTPVARKAYERLEAAVVEKENARLAAEKKTAAYQNWYEKEALPYVTDTEAKLKTTEATLIGERARLKALQEAGLIEVAANDDAAKKAAEEAAKRGMPEFDASKYVPREQFNELAVKAADSITLVADLAQEHSALGLPPVSWRTLKTEASAAGQDVETYWKAKFGVEAARAAKSAAAVAAHEAKIAEQAIAKYKQEHPASAVNPALGFGSPSSNPFTGKVPSASDAQHPWNRSDSEKVNSRINKVLQAHPDIAGNA
jgi:hypothetical protein